MKLSHKTFKKPRHNKMRLVYDPTGFAPEGFGVFGVAAFKWSYPDWPDGSIWHAYAGTAPNAYFEKQGEYMQEVDFDPMQQRKAQ